MTDGFLSRFHQKHVFCGLSSADEKSSHLINEKKEDRTRTEQINDITEDRASVSSTDMLVSNIVFFSCFLEAALLNVLIVIMKNV